MVNIFYEEMWVRFFSVNDDIFCVVKKNRLVICEFW